MKRSFLKSVLALSVCAAGLVVGQGCRGLPTKPAASTSGNSAGAASAQSAPIVNAWLQWTPETVLEARAIVSTPECPEFFAGETKLESFVRAKPTSDFPLRTCVAKVPLMVKGVRPREVRVSHVVQVSPDGAARNEVHLRVPAQNFSRVVIVGDTGCRLKSPSKDLPGGYQDCNDARKWPLKQVMVSAANFHPDLVVHLGDFHYRESPCAPGKNCEGSPFGFQWSAWNEDFFAPAAPLLEEAPWIFVRGNHEACSRAWDGWNRFLEPWPIDAEKLSRGEGCQEKSPAYVLKFGSHELTILDTAEESSMAPEISALNPGKGYQWLLLHRPFLTKNESPKRPSAELIPELLHKPGRLSLVMAGHVHTLSLNQFADFRPPELIIGNGSTALDVKTDFLVKKPGDTFEVQKGFGFVSLERRSVSNWKLRVHDVDGKLLKSCDLKESPRRKTVLRCD